MLHTTDGVPVRSALQFMVILTLLGQTTPCLAETLEALLAKAVGATNTEPNWEVNSELINKRGFPTLPRFFLLLDGINGTDELARKQSKAVLFAISNHVDHWNFWREVAASARHPKYGEQVRTVLANPHFREYKPLISDIAWEAAKYAREPTPENAQFGRWTLRVLTAMDAIRASEDNYVSSVWSAFYVAMDSTDSELQAKALQYAEIILRRAFRSHDGSRPSERFANIKIMSRATELLKSSVPSARSAAFGLVQVLLNYPGVAKKGYFEKGFDTMKSEFQIELRRVLKNPENLRTSHMRALFPEGNPGLFKSYDAATREAIMSALEFHATNDKSPLYEEANIELIQMGNADAISNGAALDQLARNVGGMIKDETGDAGRRDRLADALSRGMDGPLYKRVYGPMPCEGQKDSLRLRVWNAVAAFLTR